MIRFRPKTLDGPPGDCADLLAVGQLIDDAIRPGHFFVASDLCLTWITARAETIPWEIFRGRALDASQTRLQKSFLSWSVLQADAEEPLVSVKLDVHSREIHVTRGLLVYGWEACDTGGGIDSRATVKWQRELVGTIALADFADLESVRDELIGLIWQAMVGTSRLPLTSVEAPLPAFVFGQMHYAERPDAGDQPVQSWIDFLAGGLQPDHAWRENVKLVEFVLRHAGSDEVGHVADLLAKRWKSGDLPKLFRKLFNDISLSPHTRFVDNALACLDRWAEAGVWTSEVKADFLAYLLRQLGRHLTAYDLVTFHHRGANYPDALLLDAVLKRYSRAIEAASNLFLDDHAQARLRRRALRQACLLRRHYEGHLVPDLPTSPGENARVLPASHPRVPEEQLLQPLQRRRALYADDPLAHWLTPLARQVLEKSVRDLEHLDERVEMGLGVFIDRPLGYGKQIGEPDLTPLLAHEAFSPSLARRRWCELKALCAELAIPADAAKLDALFEHGRWPTGLAHAKVADCPRPTAALCDVRKVAAGFVILHTLPKGMQVLLDLLTPADLAEIGTPRLCVPIAGEAGKRRVAIYDDAMRCRLTISVDTSAGWITRAGIELPRAGLSVWEDRGNPGETM